MLIVRGPAWWELKKERLTPTDLLNRLGFVRPPIDVAALARMIEVDVRTETEPGLSGRVKVDSSGAWITSNPSEPFYRQRFTLAHELGHLMMHPIHELQEGRFRDTNFEGNRQEAEANAYAAGLLMPMWMVAEYGLHAGFDPVRVARIFGVSRQAAEIRLRKVAGL